MRVLNVTRQAKQLLRAGRSQLEWCVQAGAPHFQRDVGQLETVQGKVMREFENLTYEGRLKESRLFRKKTGLRGDAVT